MKTSTCLVLAVAVVISLATGCRTASPKLTPLQPDRSGAGKDGLVSTGPDDVAPLVRPSAEVSSADLPNEDKLAGRDLDRQAFAAQTV
jgi:hypothetical protein